MKRAVTAFVSTVALGFVGALIDANLFNVQGLFSVIFSVATSGAFIVAAIEDLRSK